VRIGKGDRELALCMRESRFGVGLEEIVWDNEALSCRNGELSLEIEVDD